MSAKNDEKCGMLKSMKERNTDWLYDFFEFDKNNEVNRVGFNDAHMRCVAMLIKKLQELGMTVTYDHALNVRGTIGDGAKSLAILSHADSAKDAGQYDGLAGVVAGILTTQKILELKKEILADMNLNVVITGLEEVERFGVGCISSKILSGDITDEQLDRIKDKDGITVREALVTAEETLLKHLDRLSAKPIKKVDNIVGKSEIDHALEMHIEFGSALTREGADIGVVDEIAAVHRFGIDAQGEPAHPGTPMDERVDAALAANMLYTDLHRIAKGEGNLLTQLLTETSDWNLATSMPSVSQLYDARLFAPWTHERMQEEVSKLIERVEKETGVKITSNILSTSETKIMPEEGVQRLMGATKKAGLKVSSKPCKSEGGHDIVRFPSQKPGMIFVPKKGRLHHPSETMKEESLHHAASVMTEYAKDIEMD